MLRYLRRNFDGHPVFDSVFRPWPAGGLGFQRKTSDKQRPGQSIGRSGSHGRFGRDRNGTGADPGLKRSENHATRRSPQVQAPPLGTPPDKSRTPLAEKYSRERFLHLQILYKTFIIHKIKKLKSEIC